MRRSPPSSTAPLQGTALVCGLREALTRREATGASISAESLTMAVVKRQQGGSHEQAAEISPRNELQRSASLRIREEPPSPGGQQSGKKEESPVERAEE
ncbi:unnamed protein product [Urochloa humidicola]